MPPAARVTDSTTHGMPLAPGPGSTDVLIGYLPAWRAMIDQHACPAVSVSGADGVGSVMMGSPTVLIDYMMACRVGDIVVEKPGLALGPVNPILMGELSNEAAIKRTEGIKKVVKEQYPNIKIVREQTGNWKRVISLPFLSAASPGKIISTAQAKRAADKFNRVSVEDRIALLQILGKASSSEERLYIWKAFAACHSVEECRKFADKIRGKNKTWLNDHLKLTGSSKGKGVQQQWSHSCNATTVEAVHGEMDPVYALKVHEDNPKFGSVDDADATKKNPKLAADQKAMLESTYAGSAAGAHKGVAANRGNAAAGSGRWASDKFNQLSKVTGATYVTEKDPNVPNAMKSIDASVRQGVPVPIVIGNGPGQYTHYVLVTGSKAGPPKTYSIHDPWTGTTVSRSADAVKNGRINIAGSNQITAIENPKLEHKSPALKAKC